MASVPSKEMPVAEGKEDVLEKQPGDPSAALAKRDEERLTQMDPVAGAISAPVSQRGLNHLVLNCIIPGLGSLAHGKKGLGWSQLVLALASVPFFLYHWYFGLPLLMGAYLWSLISGLEFVKERQGDLVWD